MNYFQFAKRKSRDFKNCTFLIPGRKNFLYILLLITFFISYLSVNSQTNRSAVKNIKFDTVPHASIKLLDSTESESSNAYQKSVSDSDKSLNKIPAPFFPYFNINLSSRYLPQIPLRIYLGKLSIGNSNDYVFIAAPCRKNPLWRDSPLANTYDDLDVDTSPSGLAKEKKAKWFVIGETKLNDTLDKVSYTRLLDKDKAIKYVQNFKASMKAHGLANKYFTCFVIKAIDGYKIQLRPVVTNAKFQAIIYDFTFKKHPDANGGSGTCCDSPPEGGNSIKDQDDSSNNKKHP